VAYHQEWLENLRAVAAETKKLVSDTMPLLALLEPGYKASGKAKARDLVGKWVPKEQHTQGYDVIQAMKSIWQPADVPGLSDRTMASAETVFKAGMLGVPVSAAKDIEVFGAGRKMAPGEAIRMAYAAGQKSGRDPAALAITGPALPYFDDPRLAFGMAQALSKRVLPGQLGTYAKRGGEALQAGGPLREWFAAKGVGKGATQVQRIEALAAAGLDTPGKLEDEVGRLDKRHKEALAAIVSGWEDDPEYGPGAKSLMGYIDQVNMPGYMGSELWRVYKEDPESLHQHTVNYLENQRNRSRLEGAQADRYRFWDRQLKRTEAGFAAAGMDKGVLDKIPLVGGMVGGITGQGEIEGWSGALNVAMTDNMISASLGPIAGLVRSYAQLGRFAMGIHGARRGEQEIMEELQVDNYNRIKNEREIADSLKTANDQRAAMLEGPPGSLSNPTDDR